MIQEITARRPVLALVFHWRIPGLPAGIAAVTVLLIAAVWHHRQGRR
jgi:hypothetical protein